MRKHAATLTKGVLILLTFVSSGRFEAQLANLESSALQNLQSGHYSLEDVVVVRTQHRTDAIPSLQRRFEEESSVLNRDAIAGALVELGDADGKYFNYLTTRGEEVVSSTMPNPARYDSSGIRQLGVNDAFTAWARAHNVTPEQAAEKQVNDELLLHILAASKKPQAIQTLRRALHSPNDSFVLAAATGLAQLHDQESVPEIIRVARTVPKEIRQSIAMLSLMQFHNKEAQDAARSILPADLASEVGKQYMYDN